MRDARPGRDADLHMTASQVTLVVAMAANGVIGRGGELPWRLPADLRQFKADTLGKPVVMGRRTFESIGRALPGRHNIVLTRDSALLASASRKPMAPETQLSVVADWSGVLQAAGNVKEIMVIGGAEIYALALPRADSILLTRVEADIDGDTRFPTLDLADWQEIERERRPADAENPYSLRFLRLTRRR